MADTPVPLKYRSAPNGESPPFRADGVPPVDPREVLPHSADKVINPPPIPANGFRPGAAADYEYVTGHKGIFFSQYIKAIGPYIDDLTADLGDDIYDRMMNDSQIDSCMRVLKVGVLSEEGKILSPIQDEKDPRFEMGQKVQKFCEFVVRGLPLPLTCTLDEMLDGVAIGNKVAEIILEAVDYTEYAPDGQEQGTRKVWSVESIRTKARGSTAFLVDAYMRVLGVLGQIPGLPYPIVSGQLVSDPSTIPNLLPRQKFMIFSNNPKNMDPRGSSGLRSSYTPWWIKQQTYQEMLKYLATYGVPSLWGTTPEGAQEKVETDPATGIPTGTIISPEQDLSNLLAKLRGGVSIGVTAGTTINAIPVQGATGQMAFLQTMDWSDKQMAKAILAQTLATEEGQHMARAASDNHMEILELGLRLIKARLASMVKRDLFYPLVEFNYGTKVAKELCPDYVLTDMNRSDWAMWSQVAVNMFTSGYMTIEQKQWVDKKLGLPKTQGDNQELPGNLPANYVVQKMTMDMQAQAQQQQMQAEQQAQAQQQQQQPQGMVPQGLQSPDHPKNQQDQQPTQEAA